MKAGKGRKSLFIAGRANLGGSSGFTLMEMAMVLAISGLIVGGAVPLAKVYLQNTVRNRIVHRLEEAKKAVVSYWQVHGELPCPDANKDGKADCGSGGGIRLTGSLPWSDLGTAPDDGSGRPITYTVLRHLTGHSSLSNPQKGSRCESLATLSISTALRVDLDGNEVAVPFVVVSGGAENRDGSDGYLDGENADGNDGLYEKRAPDETFDDVVEFASAYELLRLGCGTLVVQNVAGGDHTDDLRVEQSLDGKSSWLNLTTVSDGASSDLLRIESGSWIRVVDSADSSVIDEFVFGPSHVTLVYDGP